MQFSHEKAVLYSKFLHLKISVFLQATPGGSYYFHWMRDAGLSIKAWLDINDNDYDKVIFHRIKKKVVLKIEIT
jgi:hypothetical protein